MALTSQPTTRAPRWLIAAGAVSLALLGTLLALGSLVTSFRVGMADPVWPTEPWFLLTGRYQEPSAGFLIEHAHRLVAFAVGGVVALFALGTWLATAKGGERVAAGVIWLALMAAFGQMHGTLIKHQRLTAETGVVSQPNWPVAVGPTAVTLAAWLAVTAATVSHRGWPMRVAASLLLVAVMVQGVLGGLRVYLNALVGTDLATIHGVFSQLVLALHVVAVLLLVPVKWVPLDDRYTPLPRTVRLAVIAAIAVYGQIIAGAVLRHAGSTVGARLHLLIAFVAFAAIVAAVRALADAPRSVRTVGRVLHAILGVQLLLGVEAWMLKFSHGIAAGAWTPITPGDAAVRTLHTLNGYLLFAVTVALATRLLQHAIAHRPVAIAAPARTTLEPAR